MNLTLPVLTSLIEETPAFRRLLALLKGDSSPRAAVPNAAKPYVIAAIYKSLKRPMLIVTAQPEKSKEIHGELPIWAGTSRIDLFPEPDTLPYQQATHDSATEVERLKALASLTADDYGDNPPLVVAPTPALMEKTLAREDFASRSHTLEIGMTVEPMELMRRWEGLGYQLEEAVEVPGTMARRGGIVDIYPPFSELPARVEFFGNTIDSIRLFDPREQRSREEVGSVDIAPASEGLESPRDTILSYLPPHTLVVLDEPEEIKLAADDLDEKARELRAERIARGDLPPHSPIPYLTWDELRPQIERTDRMEITWAGAEDAAALEIAPTLDYAGQMERFINKTKDLLSRKRRIILVSHQAARLSELLEEEGVLAPALEGIKHTPPPGSLTLVNGLLPHGWAIGGDTYLFTDREIFGFTKERRLQKKRRAPHRKLLAELKPGDFVVHIEHGIGRFAAISNMPTEGGQKDFLVLEYAAGDRLYVPTDHIDRIGRYIGASERPPTLTHLGTREWGRRQQRAREAAEEVAQELLALYASRGVVPGFAYPPDTIWQGEMEASFPYMETPDQIRAQQEIKQDMEKAKPMDRLVCGDVGYGKTEVAVRAAFKAVMGGKQVAVLVPTTVLVEQHVITFTQRLGAFPVRIEALSRFKKHGEQQETLKELTTGGVDICIGTHRLLQRDVTFKNLGLLIIDEEQRFGVAHKEHLKRMRQEVDVLTLSATPIPRTLHMSLAGVRDMSVMETPPEDRLPIKTYVAAYDEQLIREAVLREIERNGQVFFVHNRVQNISVVAAQLQAIVPQARIAVAHGQMAEGTLEQVMSRFARGECDVLVATTIIESGLDMPNVNTLIVNQADRFGLTQLYQLRGRVGRGANLAYAYLLYDGGKRLGHTATRRLQTIYQAAELGAGLNIAIKDLEIRGAGTLLGNRQSGQITAVGFNLYCRILEEAVAEQKAKLAGEPPPPLTTPPPNIDLPLEAYIPPEYVTDLAARLNLYQRMAAVTDPEVTDGLAAEMADRFGNPPPQVRNLLYTVRLKALATRAGVESITTEGRHIVVTLLPGLKLDRRILDPVAEEIRLGPNRLSLDYKRLRHVWQRLLEEVVKRVG